MILKCMLILSILSIYFVGSMPLLPGGSSHESQVGYIPGFLSGISRVNPLTAGVVTYLLNGMSHQVICFFFFGGTWSV